LVFSLRDDFFTPKVYLRKNYNLCFRMHEIGIITDLIEDVLQKISGKRDVSRVVKIYVRLGKDADESRESLVFWFENLSRATELEGACLEFISSPGNKIVVDSLEVE